MAVSWAGFCTLCWGRLTLTPELTVREEYNDNIYLDRVDKQSDFITIVFPRLSILEETNYLNLELGYGLRFLHYQDHSQENETRIKDVQRITGRADILPGRDFSILVEDSLTRVPIDDRLPGADDNEIVNRTNLNRFMVNPRYSIGRSPGLTSIIGYTYETLSYQNPIGDDSESHTGYVDLTKDLSSRLSLSLGYLYRNHLATYTENYTRQDVSGGIVYRVSSPLTLVGHLGQSWIDYSGLFSEQTLFWDVGFDYGITNRITTGVHYSQELLVSVYDGLYERVGTRGTLIYEGPVHIDLDVHHRTDTYKTVNRRDRTLGGSMGIALTLSRTLMLRLSGFYDYLRFDPQEERVRRYGVGPVLEYRRNKLTLSGGYRFREENSHEGKSGDYTNHIAFVEANLAF